MNSSLWAVGMLLLVLRGKIPDFISIVISNSMLALGVSYLYIGSRKLLNLQRGIRFEWFAVAFIFVTFYIFSSINESHAIRAVLFSLVVIPILGATGWVYYKHADTNLKRLNQLSAIILFFGVLVFLIRIATAHHLNTTSDSMKSPNILYSLPFFYAIILNAWFSTMLALKVSAKLQEQIKIYHQNEIEQSKKNEEELLELNEELKKSYTSRLKAMSEVISNIAHQWRQPLNRINSNLAVINSTLHDESSDINLIEAKIANIKRNTKYMSSTIEDFLNIFHSNKEKKVFSLQQTIEKLVEMVDVKSQNVEIIYNIEDRKIDSFESEFSQVVLIILNNALDNFKIKNTSNPKITIAVSYDEKNILVQICDNGGGIESESIERIFEPYFTTKFKLEGTGLGLYMSKMIIENSFGGTIRALNRGDGACFEISMNKEI